MIYPKFSQRQLAVVVLCLLLTLGAVGVSFLIYFFNEQPLVLNTVYTKTERYDVLLPQHVVLNNEYTGKERMIQGDEVSADEENATVDSIELLNATDKFDIQKTPGSTTMQRNVVDYDTDVSSADDRDLQQSESDAEQQSIYIDELDKPNIPIEEGINSHGDYFKSSKETSNELNRLSKQRLRQQQMQYNAAGIVPTPYLYRKESRIKQTEVKEPNLDQVYDNINMATANDDDESATDDEEGSGSGYFDNPKLHSVAKGIYDDDTNNFIRRISLKMLQTHSHALKLQQRPKRIRASPRPKRLKGQRNMNEAVRFNRFTDENKTGGSLRQLYADRLTLPARVDSQSRTIYRKVTSNAAEGNQNLGMSSSERQRSALKATWDLRSPSMNTRLQQQQQHSLMSMSPAWLETRTRRIIGNVKKSEERSRQLLLCEKEEAGGGELCRMLFKGHLND